MKIKYFILITLCTALLSGCSESGRVNEKKYLRGAAIDGSRYTLAFFTSSGEKEEIIEVEASDPLSALKTAELESGMQVFTGYTEIAVLGDCPRNETLEALLSQWKVSPECIIVSTAPGEAGKLIRDEPIEKLEGTARQAQRQGIAPSPDIISALQAAL